MKKVKVGVVGVGALGRHHARLYGEISEAEVVGVFDVNIEAAKKVGEEFGLNTFSSMEELANACEAISVAVPATHHATVALPLIEKGKHLLIEKPLAADLDSATKIVEAARAKNVIVGVGHTERFNPALKYVHEHAKEIRYIEARRMAPYPPERPGAHRRGTEVGVVLDLMIHDLDIVLNMVRSEVESVEAVGDSVLSETEDIINARIKFKNGCVANITTNRISEKSLRQIRVYQTDACVSIDMGDHTAVIYEKRGSDIVKKELPVDESNALKEELRDFVHCVLEQDGRAPRVCVNQGYAAMELAVKVVDEMNRHNRLFYS